MRSAIGEPSVLLWVASALIAVLGARTFIEFLRRLHHDGPVRLWRELLLGAAALVAGWWSAIVIDVSAQGLPFEIGYQPVKVFGSLLLSYVAMVLVVGWLTFRHSLLSQGLAVLAATLVAVVLQVSVLWSIGAEPGLFWRVEPLLFAAMLFFVGMAVAVRMVVGIRRRTKSDRGGRRILASLVLGACAVAAQELVLTASGIDRQVVSAHARFLPEVAITLVAGAVLPIGMLLLLVDQRSQQRARAAERRRRRLEKGEDYESTFDDQALMGLSDSRHTTRQ